MLLIALHVMEDCLAADGDWAEKEVAHCLIRESVDSLCRDGTDTPIVCVH